MEPVRTNYLKNLGYNPLEPQGWGDVAEVNADSMWAKELSGFIDGQFLRLETFLKHAQIQGVPVVGIIFPQSPKYKETGSFGRYGPQRSVAVLMVERLKALQDAYPNFVLMDENQMGDHDYTDSMAYESDHLSALGANQLTGRLDSVLKTLETFR